MISYTKGHTHTKNTQKDMGLSSERAYFHWRSSEMEDTNVNREERLSEAVYREERERELKRLSDIGGGFQIQRDSRSEQLRILMCAYWRYLRWRRGKGSYHSHE